MPQSRTPSLAEVIRRALEARVQDIHVALPARVESYDATKQVIDAKPLIKETDVDPDGSEVTTSLPVITNVPVVFPGAGGFRVTFPVQVGDTVLLVFAERSLDKWLAHGGEVDPVDLRRHALSDAVAIPGLHPNNAPWSGADASNMTLGADTGPQIQITTSEVQLGGSTGLDSLVLLQAFKALFDAHTHISAAPSSPTSPPTPLASTYPGLGSTVAKAK